MKTIKFIKTKNGKKETIYTWTNIVEKNVESICCNFMTGFLYGVDNYSKFNFIRPMVMSIDGYMTWTRDNLKYEFVIEEEI